MGFGCVWHCKACTSLRHWFPTLVSYLALSSKQPTVIYQTIFILNYLDKLLLCEHNWILKLYHTNNTTPISKISCSTPYKTVTLILACRFLGHCMHTIHKMQWFMSKERPKWVVKYLWIDFLFSYVSLSFFYVFSCNFLLWNTWD